MCCPGASPNYIDASSQSGSAAIANLLFFVFSQTGDGYSLRADAICRENDVQVEVGSQVDTRS